MARHNFKVLVTRTSITPFVVLHVTLDFTKGLDMCGPGDVGGAPTIIIMQITLATGASYIGTQALTVDTLWLLAFHQEVSDLEVGQEEPTNCVMFPQFITGEQGAVVKGCH